MISSTNYVLCNTNDNIRFSLKVWIFKSVMKFLVRLWLARMQRLPFWSDWVFGPDLQSDCCSTGSSQGSWRINGSRSTGAHSPTAKPDVSNTFEAAGNSIRKSHFNRNPCDIQQGLPALAEWSVTERTDPVESSQLLWYISPIVYTHVRSLLHTLGYTRLFYSMHLL